MAEYISGCQGHLQSVKKQTVSVSVLRLESVASLPVPSVLLLLIILSDGHLTSTRAGHLMIFSFSLQWAAKLRLDPGSPGSQPTRQPCCTENCWNQWIVSRYSSRDSQFIFLILKFHSWEPVLRTHTAWSIQTLLIDICSADPQGGVGGSSQKPVIS